MSVLHSTNRRFLLRELNIFGFDHLDPIILAALADERPLLLIGAHGTAKSELLNRLAAALGLEHRHYNASLISFDDLLGYPVPNAEHDGLQYLRTPGDLWDAESVFLDEISRCRPETQNKLFSIIHERRVQGLHLENLRFRWAAMNPPVSDDGELDNDTDIYDGSIPLDPALADRFAYIAAVPSLLDLSSRDRRRLLSGGGNPPAIDSNLPALITRTRECRAAQDNKQREWVNSWVETLTVPLHEARLGISGRRAVSLAATALSVYAACQALHCEGSLADAAFLALRAGLPQRARGRAISGPTLRAIHRAAESAVGEPNDSPWRAIRAEPDPVNRIRMALNRPADAVNRMDMSTLVQDALAGLPLALRHTLAVNLMPVFGQRDLLTANASELLLNLNTPIFEFIAGHGQEIHLHPNREASWDTIRDTMSVLNERGEPLMWDIGNLIYALFALDDEPFDPLEVAHNYIAWNAMFESHVIQEVS